MEWKKVEDKIFKFSNVGDFIEGKLLSKEEGKNFNNMVYKIKKDDGEVMVVFGTKVIDSRMTSVSIGQSVKIEFTGTKAATKKGQNDTMLFEVYTA